MSMPVYCPECGSDDIVFFVKREEYQCECGHCFASSQGSVLPMRIFLSYGHDRNEELILRIKTDLEAIGHDVWVDREKIKFADDWRRTITDGIRNSDWMFSFLSKHSTSDPGVCLDELGIALGTKGGIVQTILVESEEEFSLPASISHLQWLDMHDWRVRQQNDSKAFENWYSAKFKEIRRVVESKQNQRFAGEIEQLNQKLKPVTMDAFTAKLLGKGFTGRQWLVEELEEWLQKNSSQVFALTGEPGVGKSAFTAWLSHYNKADVLAAVFIRYNQPQSCESRRIIHSIAFQLASRLPDYRKQLIHLTEINKLADKNDDELFTYLLSEPLRLCIDGNRSTGLILIDALDEATASGVGIAGLLARHAQELPPWLRFVVTTRPEPRLLSVLAALYPHEFNANDARNRQDIAEYLHQQLATFAPDNKTIAAIVDKSEGIFLYAEQAAAQVLEKTLSLERIEVFPVGLAGIYSQFFQRQFADIERYYETTIPVLQVLLAAQEPLTREELSFALGWDESTIHRQLLVMGSFFPEAGGKIQPYHRSVKEWLIAPDKAGDYYVSSRAGHHLLATAGWEQLEKQLSAKVVDPDFNNVTLYTGAHLYASGQEDSLETMFKGVMKRMNKEVPDIIFSTMTDNKVSGYTGIFLELVAWVAEHEEFTTETLFKRLLEAEIGKAWGYGNKITMTVYLSTVGLTQTGFGTLALYLLETCRCILEELLNKKPHNNTRQFLLSFCYDQIGVIYSIRGGDHTRAVEMSKKGLVISQDLVAKKPKNKEYKLKLAQSYLRCGEINKRDGVSEKNLEELLEALKISKAVVAKKPQDSNAQLVLAQTYIKIGENYGTADATDKALEMFQNALKIGKTLVSEKEEIFTQQILVLSYYNIGDIYETTGATDNARAMFNEAIKTCKSILAKAPNLSDVQRDLAGNYSRVGNIYQARGNTDKALDVYKRGLKIMKLLTIQEPERSDYQYSYVEMLHNIGNLYRETGKAEQALEMYKEELSISKTLASKELENNDWQRGLVGCYNQIGAIYQAADNADLAMENFQEGLKIMQALVEKNPLNNSLQYSLAGSYGRVGVLSSAASNAEQSLELLQKGLNISKLLVDQEPQRSDYQHSLGASFFNIGKLYRDTGALKQAVEMFQKSLKTTKVLVAKDPKNNDWQDALLKVYSNFGALYQDAGNAEQALEMYLEGLKTLEAQATREPDNSKWQRWLVGYYCTVGGLYQDTGNAEQALEMYLEELKIHSSLLAEAPGSSDLLRNFVATCYIVGTLYKATGDIVRALEIFQEELEILNLLVANDPRESNEWKRELAGVLIQVAVIYQDAGSTEMAFERYQELLRICKALVVEEPNNSDWQHILAITYYRFGTLFQDTSNDEQALEKYQKSLKITKALVAKDPDNSDLRLHLAESYHKVGALCRKTGNAGQALEMYQEEIETRKSLSEAGY